MNPLLCPLLIPFALGGPRMIPEAPVDVLGQQAPVFELPLLGGGSFRIEDHRGKYVAVAFWASWCAPCRHELPALAELHRRRDDLEVVAVNVDRDRGDALSFLEKVEDRPMVAWDHDSSVLGSFLVAGMPTVALIDPSGRVKHLERGYSVEKGLAELEEAMEPR